MPNLSDPAVANEDNYEELLVSLEAAADKFNLLLAVCDDIHYREELIEQIEKEKGVKELSLVTLYARMGNIYYHRLKQGKCQDYQQEQALGIEYYRKAVDLQQELGLEEDLATRLNNLAVLYESLGRYSEAEPLYEQAIEIDKRSLPQDHPSLATHLNNLAGLYKCLGTRDFGNG